MVLKFFLLASIFLFTSCSDLGERDNPDDPDGINFQDCDMNYRTERIGDQVWMTENLNCDVSGSKCYDNKESNCATYGRLYNWATAMNLPAGCNSSICASKINAKHRGICPEGWHIPSDAEWTTLTDYVGYTAGKYLKAENGWNSGGNGNDMYGFSALPGGNGNSGGSFSYVGNGGYWWSATEYNNSNYAYYRYIYYYNEYVDYNTIDKSRLFSVRCVQD